MMQSLVNTAVHAKKASVSQCCKVFGVSRSGLYAARQRQRSAKQLSVLDVQATAAFEASGQSYGSRRLSAALKAQGLAVGRHKARGLMRRNGLRARWRRKFTHTTDSRHSLPVAANVLNRQFTPQAPNRAWVCDITYVRTRSGWLYLAAVLDLFSRKVVGWAMASSMPAQLVCSALSMAITSRCPPAGLLVHSDRGSQYASAQHSALLARHGLIGSMSGKGNCWDNAVSWRARVQPYRGCEAQPQSKVGVWCFDDDRLGTKRCALCRATSFCRDSPCIGFDKARAVMPAFALS